MRREEAVASIVFKGPSFKGGERLRWHRVFNVQALVLVMATVYDPTVNVNGWGIAPRRGGTA